MSRGVWWESETKAVGGWRRSPGDRISWRWREGTSLHALLIAAGWPWLKRAQRVRIPLSDCASGIRFCQSATDQVGDIQAPQRCKRNAREPTRHTRARWSCAHRQHQERPRATEPHASLQTSTSPHSSTHYVLLTLIICYLHRLPSILTSIATFCSDGIIAWSFSNYLVLPYY